MSDLSKLARPFPRELVERNPGGKVYVAHENVTQWLLGIVGPFDFEVRELFRGNPDATGKRKEKVDNGELAPLTDVIVGGIFRLTVTIDGRRTSVEEIGEVEDPYNWAHDGLRAKMAASDGLKRCAMRIGLGLHLWSGDKYVLDGRLAERNGQAGS